MIDLAGYTFVIFLSIIFFAFPGIFIAQWLKTFNNFSKIIITIFLSTSFWICISWYISLFGLPLSYTVGSLHLFFIFLFFASKYYKNFKTDISEIKKIPLHYIVLGFIILFEFYPLYTLTIVPGGDAAMHGYITRLIINKNGLPTSFRPILPVDYFGSYSAGYHIFTALLSGVDLIFIRYAINFVSLATYPLTLLGLIFLLKNFISEKNAIYSSIIYFTFCTSFITTITWGGNSTIFSIAFCFFSVGFFVQGIVKKHKEILFFSSLPIASIFLIHMIPGIAFVYISILGYIIISLLYRRYFKWILQNSSILLIFVFILLLPFIFNFRNQSSPELIKMIKDWQNLMMRNNFTGVLSKDLIVTFEEMYYRIGYDVTLTTCISLIFLLYYKRFFETTIILCFYVLIYIFVFNSRYWFFPMSELLYPERVVFFVIPVWACVFAYALEETEKRLIKITILKKTIKFYNIIIIYLIFNSFRCIKHANYDASHDKRVVCNKLALESFDWINKNTEKNAIFEVSYAFTGMWIPTFTNRAAHGTHLHFIHICQKIPDSLVLSKNPRYYYVSKGDSTFKTGMDMRVKDKQIVFGNDEIKIYK